VHRRDGGAIEADAVETPRCCRPRTERVSCTTISKCQTPGCRATRDWVLVADDNEGMRKHLGGILEEWWDVETVADGQAALDAVAFRKPDLVLTDVMMVGLDGTRLVALLREDPRLIAVPIIILSAADEEARIEGMSTGADDYVVKSVSSRELVARVCANLARAPLRRYEYAAIARLYELGTG
jgi:DNA-binding response OmpR family regulator